jgi:hypothetical protein
MEQMNTIMDHYFRAFIKYQQNDWTRWLSMAEFATNNPASEATECSPFFGNYSSSPRMNFGQHPVQNNNSIREANANALSQKMNEIFK